MTRPSRGSDLRDAATFVVPGAVGIGVGVLVATLVSGSIPVIGAFALLGAAVGHVAGYLLLRGRGDRFD